MRSIVFVFLVVISVSCTQTEFTSALSTNDVRVFSFPKEGNDDVDFSQFIERIEIVPLETSSSTLFRRIFDFVDQRESYYVFDNTLHALYRFDNDDGRFISKLDKRGKGPDEYLELRDFDVDSAGNVHVLSYRKILVYDSLNKLIRSVPLSLPGAYNINPIQFAFSSNGGYYLFSGSFGVKSRTENQYSIYEVNREGVFTGRVLFPVASQMMGQPRFYKIDRTNSYNMTPFGGVDTVYRFADGKVFPMYYFDYGERRVPRQIHDGFNNAGRIQKALTTTNYVVATHSVIETSGFIFFTTRSNNNIWKTIVAKDNSHFFCFATFGAGGTNANNYFPVIMAAENEVDCFSGYIPAFSLLEGLRSGHFKRKFGYLDSFDRLAQLIGGLKETDNPVIVKLFMKKFD